MKSWDRYEGEIEQLVLAANPEYVKTKEVDIR